MARPKPQVIHSIQLGNGAVWDIMKTDSHYIITYKGSPCGVRHSNEFSAQDGFRYQKLSYTGLGSALAQARRLNHIFKCLDFDVMEVA